MLLVVLALLLLLEMELKSAGFNSLVASACQFVLASTATTMSIAATRCLGYAIAVELSMETAEISEITAVTRDCQYY